MKRQVEDRIDMVINFDEGIKLVIDDDKLLWWDQSDDKKMISLAIKQVNGYGYYQINLSSHIVEKDVN